MPFLARAVQASNASSSSAFSRIGSTYSTYSAGGPVGSVLQLAALLLHLRYWPHTAPTDTAESDCRGGRESS
eukprot:5734266-Alexandrium_andersonii.AAC.1